MTSTLDPKAAEKQCNQNIDLNDDDDQFLTGSNQENKENQPKNASNDEDDDFFSELGGSKNSRPNPGKLINGSNANTPTNLDSLSKEIQSMAIQKGDDEPSDICISVTDPRKIGDSFLGRPREN